MVSSVLGNRIADIAEPENAPSLMVLSPSGNTTVVKALQFINA